MRLAGHEPAPGGYMVTIEIENAYTDGTSRFDRVFVSYDDVAGRDDAHILAAIKREAVENPLARLRGQSLDRVEPAATREPLDSRLARIEGKVDEVKNRPLDSRG